MKERLGAPARLDIQAQRALLQIRVRLVPRVTLDIPVKLGGREQRAPLVQQGGLGGRGQRDGLGIPDILAPREQLVRRV